MQQPRKKTSQKDAPQKAAQRNNTARKIAFDILLRVERDGSYSNLLLDSKLKDGNLSGKDAALLTTLVYGVLENLICLDFFISHFAKRSASKIQPEVRCILRLGAYQLIFLDRVSASAAVGVSVELAENLRRSLCGGVCQCRVEADFRKP